MKKSNVLKKMAVLSIALMGTALLGACTSEYQPQPRGIGTDPSELKRSPCACLQIETEPNLPEWLVS